MFKVSETQIAYFDKVLFARCKLLNDYSQYVALLEKKYYMRSFLQSNTNDIASYSLKIGSTKYNIDREFRLKAMHFDADQGSIGTMLFNDSILEREQFKFPLSEGYLLVYYSDSDVVTIFKDNIFMTGVFILSTIEKVYKTGDKIFIETENSVQTVDIKDWNVSHCYKLEGEFD